MMDLSRLFIYIPFRVFVGHFFELFTYRYLGLFFLYSFLQLL